MKENGPSHFEEFSQIPEIEEGLVEGWVPKKHYPEFHHLPNIQYDPHIEELQDQADDLRLHNDHYHVPREIKPSEGGSWLQLLKSKWKKKSQ